MNKVILKGRLTADPELRSTPNNVSVATFTIATNRRFDREKTDFVNCEAWKQTAEFVSKYFSKGKEILAVGELHIDKSEKDGQMRYFTKVSVDEVEFCGGKNDNETTTNNDNSSVDVDVDDGDLPF